MRPDNDSIKTLATSPLKVGIDSATESVCIRMGPLKEEDFGISLPHSMQRSWSWSRYHDLSNCELLNLRLGHSERESEDAGSLTRKGIWTEWKWKWKCTCTLDYNYKVDSWSGERRQVENWVAHCTENSEKVFSGYSWLATIPGVFRLLQRPIPRTVWLSRWRTVLVFWQPLPNTRARRLLIISPFQPSDFCFALDGLVDWEVYEP